MEQINAAERILVALDVPTLDQARDLAGKLEPLGVGKKVGMELCTAAGVPAVIAALGKRGFLDLKYHDIPNTVAGAVRAAAKQGVWMLNVHALGGDKMMKAARSAADEVFVATGKRPLLIAVTILTSHDMASLQKIGVDAHSVEHAVGRLALLAHHSGMDGVVCSPREIEVVRKTVCDDGFIVVTPGIRSADAPPDDQARTMSAGEAIKAGATYVVIGRPITGVDDPAVAGQKFVDEIEQVQASC